LVRKTAFKWGAVQQIDDSRVGAKKDSDLVKGKGFQEAFGRLPRNRRSSGIRRVTSSGGGGGGKEKGGTPNEGDLLPKRSH